MIASRAAPGAVVSHLNITPEILAEERQVMSRIRFEEKLNALEKRLQTSHAREMQALERLSAEEQTHMLRYRMVLEKYTALLDGNLNEQIYRVDTALRERTALLAGELGEMGADASFVSRLHMDALNAIKREGTAEGVVWATLESRMVFIGVLGHLVNFYRNRPDLERAR